MAVLSRPEPPVGASKSPRAAVREAISQDPSAADRLMVQAMLAMPVSTSPAKPFNRRLEVPDSDSEDEIIPVQAKNKTAARKVKRNIRREVVNSESEDDHIFSTPKHRIGVRPAASASPSKPSPLQNRDPNIRSRSRLISTLASDGQSRNTTSKNDREKDDFALKQSGITSQSSSHGPSASVQILRDDVSPATPIRSADRRKVHIRESPVASPMSNRPALNTSRLDQGTFSGSAVGGALDNNSTGVGDSTQALCRPASDAVSDDLSSRKLSTVLNGVPEDDDTDSESSARAFCRPLSDAVFDESSFNATTYSKSSAKATPKSLPSDIQSSPQSATRALCRPLSDAVSDEDIFSGDDSDSEDDEAQGEWNPLDDPSHEFDEEDYSDEEDCEDDETALAAEPDHDPQYAGARPDWFEDKQAHFNVGYSNTYRKPSPEVEQANRSRFRACMFAKIAHLRQVAITAPWPTSSVSLGLALSFIQLLRVCPDVDAFVDWLLQSVPDPVYETLGRENLSVRDLLELPKLEWEEMLRNGVYIDIITEPDRQPALYTSSGTGQAVQLSRIVVSGIARRLNQYADFKLGTKYHNECTGRHLSPALRPNATMNLRGLAISSPESSVRPVGLLEGLFMSYLSTTDTDCRQSSWYNSPAYDRFDLATSANNVDPDAWAKLNIAPALIQGMRSNKTALVANGCQECGFKYDDKAKYTPMMDDHGLRWLCHSCRHSAKKAQIESEPWRAGALCMFCKLAGGTCTGGDEHVKCTRCSEKRNACYFPALCETREDGLARVPQPEVNLKDRSAARKIKATKKRAQRLDAIGIEDRGYDKNHELYKFCRFCVITRARSIFATEDICQHCKLSLLEWRKDIDAHEMATSNRSDWTTCTTLHSMRSMFDTIKSFKFPDGRISVTLHPSYLTVDRMVHQDEAVRAKLVQFARLLLVIPRDEWDRSGTGPKPVFFLSDAKWMSWLDFAKSMVKKDESGEILDLDDLKNEVREFLPNLPGSSVRKARSLQPAIEQSPQPAVDNPSGLRRSARARNVVSYNDYATPYKF